MAKGYRQVTYEDRIAINQLLKAGVSKDKIANQLGFHRSTLYRELSHNKSKVGYAPFLIEVRLAKRRKRSTKLNKNAQLRQHVISKLKVGWSPEQIAGQLKLENGTSIISHETIYAYIYSEEGKKDRLYCYLRKQRRCRYPKGFRKHKNSIPNRIPISERPEQINNRTEFGHWEGDLMMFSKGQKGNLITLRERISRFIIAIKNPSRHAKSTAENIIHHLQPYANFVYSITVDNGTEFTLHKWISEKLEAKTYFCEPYKSYQKGSIENGNGVLRNYFPREIVIEALSQFIMLHTYNQINRIYNEVQRYISIINNQMYSSNFFTI